MSWRLQHQLKRKQQLGEKEERRRRRLEEFSTSTDPVDSIFGLAKKKEDENEEASEKKISWSQADESSSSSPSSPPSQSNHHHRRQNSSASARPAAAAAAPPPSPNNRLLSTPSKKRQRVWESPSSLQKSKKIDPKWLDDDDDNGGSRCGKSPSPGYTAKGTTGNSSTSFRKQQQPLQHRFSLDDDSNEEDVRKRPAIAAAPRKQSAVAKNSNKAHRNHLSGVAPPPPPDNNNDSDNDSSSFGSDIMQEVAEHFGSKEQGKSSSTKTAPSHQPDADNGVHSGSTTTRRKCSSSVSLEQQDTIEEFTPTQEDSIQDDDDDDNSFQGKPSSSMSRKRPAVRAANDWSSSSDDEELQAVSEKLRSPIIEDGTKRKAMNGLNIIPHNPIALERAARAQEAALIPAAAGSSRKNDELWSDSEAEEEEQEKESSSSAPKRRGRRKATTQPGDKSSRSNSKLGDRTSGAGGSSKTEFWEDNIGSGGGASSQHRRNRLLEEEELRKQLHPILDKPKFGPTELEPLVMDHQDDKGHQYRHQVPAALSRYLAPFQQDGVKFMHKCLVNNMGCVLGDDMGCGKTVQVLSLLAALFEKTGTELDDLKIQRRQEQIRIQLQRRKREEDDALMQGRILDVSKTTTLSTAEIKGLELPERWWPVLIVVPPTVLDNWKKEIAQFTHFSVACYSGNDKDKALKQIASGMAEIMLTKRSMLQQATNFHELNSIPVKWKLVIIDEFHVFKSEKSLLAKHLRTMKALHRNLVLGMTGTLMQNNHGELWNLIDLVETDYLGDASTFKYHYEQPIKHGRSKTASLAMIQESQKKANELQQKLRALLIERKKEDVLKDHLPEKNEKAVMCELSPLQKEVYQHLLTLPDFDLVRKANSPCDCGVNAGFFQRVHRLKTRAERVALFRQNKDNVVKRRECCYQYPQNPRYQEGGDEPMIDPDAPIWRMLRGHDDGLPCERCPFCCGFPTLTKLYKLGDHLALLQAVKSTGSDEVGSPQYVEFAKNLEFAKVALPHVVDRLPGGSYIRRDGMMDDHFALSGKLKVLDKLLQTFSQDTSKVLLFSYSTQSLDLVQNYLRASGHSYLRMDGTTPNALRQEMADEFNSDPTKFVFLLSTRAMGTGLNLTSANKVVIFDVEWNPSNDEQAQDRAYRIGQDRDVEVYRLVAQGTIDELKYLRQLYKVHLKQETLLDDESAKPKAARLFRGIQGDKHRKGELFGYENLFRFKDGSFLSDIWKKTGRKTEEQRKGGMVVHETSKLTDALLGLGTAKVEELLQDESNRVETIVEEVAEQVGDAKPAGDGSSRSNGKAAGSGNESVARTDGSDAPAFDHGDLFRRDRGGAAVEEGDDGFDEEMGGATQNMAVIMEQDADLADDGNGSGLEDVENGDRGDGEELDAQAFDHGDLFRDDRGRAAIEEGEDGFDEEMGGGSQNMFAIYEGGVAMPDNPQDGSVDYGEDNALNDAGSTANAAFQVEQVRQNNPPQRRFEAPPPPIRRPRPAVNAAIVRVVQPPRLEEPEWVVDSDAEPDIDAGHVNDEERPINREDELDVNEPNIGEASSPRAEKDEDEGPTKNRDDAVVDPANHQQGSGEPLSRRLVEPAASNTTTGRANNARETGRAARAVSQPVAARPNVNLFGSASFQLNDKSTTFSANDLFLPTYKKKKKKRKK